MDQTQLQNQQMIEDLASLKAQVTELRDAYYRNNFSQQQIFNKYSDFTSRIKLPVVSALSSTCEVGEACVYSGGLYVAFSVNNWTLI